MAAQQPFDAGEVLQEHAVRSAPARHDLELRILGPLEIAVGETVIRPSAAKVRTLLAILVVEANRTVSVDALADRLWAGKPPASASSVVRTYVTELRRLLPGGGNRLERTSDGYTLRLAPGEIDASRFAADIDVARSSDDPALVATLLRRALRRWRGPALVEVASEPFAQAEAARLEEVRWSAVETLAEAELALGRHDVVIAELEPATMDQPFRENLVAHLMVALYRSGRQKDALDAYQRLRRALADDLGLDPSPPLRDLEAAVLRQDPSLEARRRPAGSVPTPWTSFIGRGTEIAAARRLLDEARLVTLVGPGGAGKTRLALELARETAGAAWFVELAPVQDPTQVLASIAATVGAPPEGDPAGAIRATLAGAAALVVLDNCEHVATAAAEAAALLVDVSPSLRVLATSRAPLRMLGEAVLTVPPLALPDDDEDLAASDAVRLFLDRVALARGGRAADPAEAAAACALCRRLDGLPLAIELAAARAASMSVNDVAAALRTHLAAPVTAGQTVDHHRTLDACVRWSLDLLGPEALDLLRRLVVLPGEISLNAARAVSPPEHGDAVAGWLATLADQSLLVLSDPAMGRYRLLETVRDVLRDMLSDGEAEESLDLLLVWAVEWSRDFESQLRRPGTAALLDRIDAEATSLRAALEHGLGLPDPTAGVRLATQLSTWWSNRGHHHDGKAWLTRALSLADAVPAELRAEVELQTGLLLLSCGELDAGRRHVVTALELARATGHSRLEVRALLWAGVAAHRHGETGAAREFYEGASEMAATTGDTDSAAAALAGLGDVAAAGGDWDAAIAHQLRALASFRRAGNRHGEGQALLNLGLALARRSDYDEASERYGQAQQIFAELADPSCQAASLEALAELLATTGDPAQAEHRYHEALGYRRDLGQWALVSSGLVALAGLAIDDGRTEQAATLLGAAGIEDGPLADRVRRALGEVPFLTAWAAGTSRD